VIHFVRARGHTSFMYAQGVMKVEAVEGVVTLHVSFRFRVPLSIRFDHVTRFSCGVLQELDTDSNGDTFFP
jgi:hypothetical protein